MIGSASASSRLGHGLDDLALDEDLPLAVAGGDAEVSLARLARTVHDAAHHGHAQGHGHAFETLGDLVRQRVDVDLRAPARRARDDLELALAQVQRLQDLVPDLDLFGGRRGERDADRVADALRQQDAERRGALDGALEGRARLGDAEVQRPVPRLGEQAVGLHHDDRVVVLHRDLEVVEVMLFEQRRLPDRTLHERLRGRLAVLLEQALVEGSGVHTDAEGHAGILRRLRDGTDVAVELADVAGVHAHGAASGVDRLIDVLRLEVNVGDDRDLALLRDDVEHIGVFGPGHGDADDLAAGRRELGDLLQRRVDVVRGCRRHRLDAHG